MIKRLTNILLAISVVGISMFGFMPAAHADFSHNLITDDATFNNTGSMSISSINSFLNQFPSSCISPNNGFSSPDPTGYNPSAGYTYGGNVSGGQVIYDAAQAYGLNPQVLIATLQKESSVVTGDASYHCTYINTAMGYGCPDSGSCPTNPATMSGFSKQIIHAAWLFKFGQQRSLGNTGWNVQLNNFPQGGDHWDNSDDPPTTYGGPMTQGNRARVNGGSVAFYDGYTTIDGSSVHMDSGATAALYWYTPHFSGNQNFVNIFTGWFGSPISNCGRVSNSNNGVMRLTKPDGGEFLTQSTSEACGAITGGYLWDGQMFIPNTTSTSIPIYRLSSNGNYLYTASADERDHSGFAWNGVAFYGADPSDPSTRPVYRLSDNSGHFFYTVSAAERDYFTQRQGYHLNGISFYVNENQGNSVSPVYRLSNSKGSFLYTISATDRDNAVQTSGFNYNGVSFNAIVMFNAIDVPIYRLAGPRSYLLTTSINERISAYRAGWIDEGPAFYTYGTNDGSLTDIYRLSNSSGNFLYTGSTSERDGLVGAGWNVNGISFSAP